MIGVCMFGFMALLLTVEYSQGNISSLNISATTGATSKATTTKQAKDAESKEVKDLPHKGAAEVEHESSLTIFFIILVVGEFLDFKALSATQSHLMMIMDE